MALLQEVFGIATDVNMASYVDRGGLDARLGYLLATDRHVAIHGDTKQGKSWLRSQALPDEKTLRVQCTADTHPESVLASALGQLGIQAELRRTSSHELQGRLGVSMKGGVGAKLLAKIGLEVEAEGTAARSTEVETAPIGQTDADLSWVARIIDASDCRLVVEDFHYMSESDQRSFAFILKALGEYRVYPVMVGIWPQDHLLTYYNGDLDGRVEDVHLSWSDDELRQVIEKGTSALNVAFDPALIDALVSHAYGNVGLLQRLAERVCTYAGVMETVPGTREIVGLTDVFERAAADVASGMQGRFQAFADNFVRGMRRMPQGLEVYRHLLQTVTEMPDDGLLTGIDSADLLTAMTTRETAGPIRASDLTQALDRIDRLQAKIGVTPPVLTYNRVSRKLFLADRSFLFYRKFANRSWPWDAGEEIENDLAVQEPLNFDEGDAGY